MKRLCVVMLAVMLGHIELMVESAVTAAPPEPLVLQLPKLDGKLEWLTNHKGKVVLLNFWYTTCPPCRTEIPWFVEFQQKWKKQGFTVIGISMLDTPAQVRAFNQEFAVNYPMYIGIDADDAIQAATGGMWGMPTSFLIGRDGKVLKKHIGLAPKAVIEKEIMEALRP